MTIAGPAVWLVLLVVFLTGFVFGSAVTARQIRQELRRRMVWDPPEEPSEHGPFGGTPLAFPDAPRVPSRPAAFDAFPAELAAPGRHRPTVAGWAVPRDERGPR